MTNDDREETARLAFPEWHARLAQRPPEDPRIEIWKDIAKEYRAINQELLALVRELISRLPPER